MKKIFDKHFFIGFALGGVVYCIICILLDLVRLGDLYARGVITLP